MRFLITGSAGFVGGSVGRYAVAGGHTVLGVARRSQPDRDWLGGHVAMDAAHADLAPVISSFAPDVVFHAAGSASVGSSVAAPLDDFRAAVVSWANLLDGVRRSGLRPLIVFPSSAAVYGNPAAMPIREDAAIAPISPYGFHKAACELLAREYAKCYGLKLLVVRIFSLFGPSQRRLLVWELFQQAIGPDPILWLQGTGEESRDYLHVDDLSSALLELSRAKSATIVDGVSTDGAPAVVNLASGVETPVMALATEMRRLVAPQKEIRCRGLSRAGDPVRWQADVRELVKRIPAWRSRPLDELVSECVASWKR